MVTMELPHPRHELVFIDAPASMATRSPSPLWATDSLDRDDGTLLLNVAHELRSSLLSFNLALSALDYDGAILSGGVERRLLNVLRRSSVHVQTLIENLLDAAQLGASGFSVAIGETDLVAVIREAVLVVEPLLGPNGQQVVVELPYAALIVPGDAQRLRQVLVNLLHNAIKYGPPGQPILVCARLMGGTVMVKVIDQGASIVPEEAPYLFDRFFRGASARSASGTGLGLSIAKVIVAACGGEIGVSSERDHGTAFWFTLPAV